MNAPAERSAGSLIISLMLMVVGLVTLYDTTGYTDLDSKIFPRAAAAMLILAAGASCILWVVRPTPTEGFGTGSWWRRILLVGSMLAAALAMPLIGFLFSAMVVFAGGLASGMHGAWTSRTLVLYPAISLAIITAFHVLFKHGLHVPLP